MAHAGTRYLKPVPVDRPRYPSQWRKTNRPYAEIVSAIRRVAKFGKPFTRLDIECNQRRVANMLVILCRRGELRRVRAAKPGRYGFPPALYVSIVQC